MRIRLALVFVAFTGLGGCAHHSGHRLIAGSGDAGSFILHHAVLRGGQPISTNDLPAVIGVWTYSEDQFGVVIRLPRASYNSVETFLLRTFGQPRFGPTETTDGGRLGGYRLTPKGGGIQFGFDAKGTQVIVLRPLTGQERTDGMIRAIKELEKRGAQ